MTQSSAPTMPARSGDIGGSGAVRPVRPARRRSPQAVRRRWLILGCILGVVVVAILANVGPLTHYYDAKARLEADTAKVAELKAQKAQLQGDLARLAETGHLEALAREELTYVRPGEELYIVTGPANGAEGSAPASDGGSSLTDGAGQDSLADAGQPGFLERILLAIRGLF